jgi:hypothetical protein
MTVNAGDTIQASVTYKKTNSANQLIFSYNVTDVSQNVGQSGQMPPTSKGLALSAAAYQGGVIIENDPTMVACVLTSPLGCLQKTTVGGLSKFASPISVDEPFTRVDGQGLPTYSGFDTLYRWDLISSTSLSKKLADTGPVTSMGFSVTWENFLSMRARNAFYSA